MQSKKLKRLGKLFIFAGLGLLLILGALLLVKHRRGELAEKSPPAIRPVPVHTVPTERGRLPIIEHYIGTIEPMVYAQLAPRATGHLYAVAGDVGDAVQKGAIAAVLDARLPKREKRAVAAELNGAKEALAISEKAFNRRRTLVQKGHVSKETLDEARRQYVLDRAQVKRLTEKYAAALLSLQYTRLTAPFDGIITQRMKDPGDLVAPGTPVLRIEKPAAGYKILAYIPQTTAERLSPGESACLIFKEKKQAAVIDRIQPAIRSGALAAIEIRVHKKPFNLFSGSSIGVDVTVARPEGTIIPLGCLLEKADAYHVFIVGPRHKRAQALPVRLLGKSGNQAVVDGDIPAGARLVMGNESMLMQLGDNRAIHPVAAESP